MNVDERHTSAQVPQTDPSGHNLVGHRRGGRPRVLPACHPGTMSSKSLSLSGIEVAAAAFVPLDMDPNAEGVFQVGVGVPVPGPVVAFLAEVRELGEPVVPAGFIRRFPGVVQPPGHRASPSL